MRASLKIVNDLPPCDVCGKPGVISANVYGANNQVLARHTRCKAHSGPSMLAPAGRASSAYGDLLKRRPGRAA